jgi:hypothetical protein
VAAPALSSDPIYGRLLVLDGDSLVMTPASAEAPLRLDLAGVRLVEVSQGRERLRYAGLGAVGGIVAGLYLGSNALGGSESNGLGALAGGIAGMIVGAPLGAVVAPARWRTAWSRDREGDPRRRCRGGGQGNARKRRMHGGTSGSVRSAVHPLVPCILSLPL